MMHQRVFLVVLVAMFAVLTTVVVSLGQETPGLFDLLGLDNENAAEVMEEFADPQGILCWVELPRRAAVGEEIELSVTIENGRSEDLLRLSGIEVGESFMKGFELVSVTPEPRQQDQLFGILSLDLPVDIPHGQAKGYKIKLKATAPGVYIGDVDMHEGARWLTRAAQIRVIE